MTRSDLAALGIGSLVAAGFLCDVQPGNLHNGLLALSFATVGAVVLRHRPGQREALLFLAAGTLEAALFTGRQVGSAPPQWLSTGISTWIGWAGVWPLPLVLWFVGLTLMSFPDGRLPGRAWRRMAAATFGLALTLSIISALWPVDYERAGLRVGRPFSLAGGTLAGDVFDVAQPITFLAFQLLWPACLFVRRLRAGPAEARQLRWLLGALGLNLIVLFAGLVARGSPRAGLLTVPLVPIAAGAAIIEASYESLVREVRASSRRVVEADDAARRRIERDLHDGAQHRLVVLGMHLGRLVEDAEATGSRELAVAADAARRQLLEATAELRELARGIHPSILTQDGLLAALESLADRSPIPVRLDLVELAPRARQAEATAYFVVSEALTNAARHSGATEVVVRVATTDHTMHVDVVDDGCGGAEMGRGLRGLGDRVVSVGGRLSMHSPSGEGTRLTAVLPCE